MIEFGTAHEVLFASTSAAGIRRSRAAGEFRWLARRARHSRGRALSRRRQSRCGALRGRSRKLDHQTMTPKTTEYDDESPVSLGSSMNELQSRGFDRAMGGGAAGVPVLRRARHAIRSRAAALRFRANFRLKALARSLRRRSEVARRARRESARVSNPPAPIADSQRERREPARADPPAIEEGGQDELPTATKLICCWCSIS